MKLLDKFLDLIYPPKCPFCGEIIEESSPVCSDCMDTIPLIEDETCECCGIPIGEFSYRLCKECNNEKRYFEQEEKLQQAKEKTMQTRDELNDYKIKFQRASITKEEIKAEIEIEVKNDILDRIMKHKGNLSKKTAADIIKNNDIGK
jgi:hypothetical protein